MSIHLINKYYTEVAKAIQFGGSNNESNVSPYFHKLLNEYAIQKDLILASQIDYKTPFGTIIRPDGTLKDVLSLEWGYWESKDTKDKLDIEIEKKFEKGYPNSNILFEDSKTVVLYQGGREIGRCLMVEAEKLDHLLKTFTSYTRPEVRDFRDALEHFKTDMPQVLETLRQMIEKQSKENAAFIKAHTAFLELCRESINPAVSPEDVTEMLIQHILTEEIFTSVFDDPQFHEENNISKELQKLERTFFTGNTKRNALDRIKPYYQVIKAQASRIASHTEKQKFLKVIYENFYKVYNPKAADRLGVVYTPDEIVKFMIEGVDYLLHEHFEKGLASKNVEILDPATGTGTFITELIEKLPNHLLEYKYKNEIHCNELAILPYYIANLNIEATYKQKMGKYEEFKNICLMDTLDNMGFERENKQLDMFGFSAENAVRVRRQNTKKISVIIGNPPYNAKQENYNSQNANRVYGQIDKRIKDTYIKWGTAQNQIVVYDMYTRFYRWAMDRLDKNGIIAFITNRSFIDGKTFDGFRKSVQSEFQFAYIIDTKSDVRANPKIAGTTHNVFGIQTGVAIGFLIRCGKEVKSTCQIFYATLDENWRKDEKLQWFLDNPLKKIGFDKIIPDEKANWINQTENDFETLIPIIDANVKSGKSEHAIFKNYSRGVVTQRDEWVYDFSKESLERKIMEFTRVYEETRTNPNNPERMFIKWDRELDIYRQRGIEKKFDKQQIVSSLYRPFTKQYLYFDKHFNGMTYQWFNIFDSKFKNPIIAFNIGSTQFASVASDTIVQQGSLLVGGGSTQCLPFYRLENDKLVQNITNWGQQQFQNQYKDINIGKEAIFHYCYGILHNPAYRQKYEQNLKREFPRIPFYADFFQWAAWGKELMDLHIGFEKATPYHLQIVEEKPEPIGKQVAKADENELQAPIQAKAKLKANKEAGIIYLDNHTTLQGIPNEAWQYKLGNRSALEWVLDQYKEKKPSDPTIAERFNTYRFADYKEQVIELLKKVCTVSVETVRIVGEMERVVN